MVLRSLLSVAAVLTFATAEVAPPITTVIEGYNVIAKLPCLGCPYLYRDPSQGGDEEWKKRTDDNALLLNISLPFNNPSTSHSSLHIDNAQLLPEQFILPRMYASQVLQDSSVFDIASLVDSGSFDNAGGAYFGISYKYNIRRLKSSSYALSVNFDVFEAWTDLIKPALTVELNDTKQKLLQVVVLQRPIAGAGDAANVWEIARVELVERSKVQSIHKSRIMRFHDWDSHGQKGTTSHMVNTASDSVVGYITSGVAGLLFFIMGLIALFVILCLFCIFGCGWSRDEYESAQRGKRRTGHRGSGSWRGNDVEKAKGRFKTAEELGFRSGGRVVGVGKGD